MNVEKIISRYEKMTKNNAFNSFTDKVRASDVMQIVEIGNDSLFDTAVTAMKVGYFCGYCANTDREIKEIQKTLKKNPALMELITAYSELDKDMQAAALPVLTGLMELLKG